MTLPKLTRTDQLLLDYERTGMSVADHPMRILRPRLPKGVLSSHDLAKVRHGTQVRSAGVVLCRQRPMTASGVVFVTLEHEHGFVNLVLFAKTFERLRRVATTSSMLYVEGKVERQAESSEAPVVYAPIIAYASTSSTRCASASSHSGSHHDEWLITPSTGPSFGRGSMRRAPRPCARQMKAPATDRDRPAARDHLAVHARVTARGALEERDEVACAHPVLEQRRVALLPQLRERRERRVEQRVEGVWIRLSPGHVAADTASTSAGLGEGSAWNSSDDPSEERA